MQDDANKTLVMLTLYRFVTS